MRTNTMRTANFWKLNLILSSSVGIIYGLPARQGNKQTPLVFLSLDGFRWDYLNKYGDVLPTFTKLRDEGSSVTNGLTNSFITKTFPNHRTLMTGLFEESHGIVANAFWDPNLQESFSLSNLDIAFWNQSLPLWTLAEQNGITSGCFQYPGCGVKEQNPTYILSENYIPDLTFPDLITNVSAALKHPENPPEFIAMYYFEPDHTGHMYGPDSPEMREKLKELDGDIKLLLETFGNDFNFILTSDHGFSQFKSGVNTSLLTLKLETLADHVFNNEVEVFVWPKEGKDAEVKHELEGFASSNSEVKLYYKEDYPDRWHYKHNDRIAPIMMLLPDGHQFSKSTYPYDGGQHGYDNQDVSMRPIFIANGPAFKSNFSISWEHEVLNVDIYPFMCHMLNIDPLPNNGTMTSLVPILQSEEEQVAKPELQGLVLLKKARAIGLEVKRRCVRHSCICRMKKHIKKKMALMKKAKSKCQKYLCSSKKP